MILLVREKGWTIDTAGDPLSLLIAAIEKGFPNQHFLVITSTAKVPKNRKFYKTIAANGWIIDCSVPLGGKKSDKTAQETVLRQNPGTNAQNGRQDNGPSALCQTDPVNRVQPRPFLSRIWKNWSLSPVTGKKLRPGILMNCSGAPKVIRFSNCPMLLQTVMHPRRSSVLKVCWQDNWHPLQIVAVLANQLRKLLVAKDFTTHSRGVWAAGMSYPQFQDRVMPALKAFDDRIIDQIASWYKEDDSQTREKKQKGANKKPQFDLALAGNPL